MYRQTLRLLVSVYSEEHGGGDYRKDEGKQSLLDGERQHPKAKSCFWNPRASCSIFIRSSRSDEDIGHTSIFTYKN